jgi:hypothetical protein
MQGYLGCPSDGNYVGVRVRLVGSLLRVGTRSALKNHTVVEGTMAVPTCRTRALRVGVLSRDRF